MPLTLAASEYEKFTSFIGAIKIKSSQRCLTASSVDGEAADRFSWFKSAWKTKHIIKETRWTFFRVKLVFECEFEISWSLGPLDLGTLGPWDSWTSSLLQHLLKLPLHPLTSSYFFLLLSSFGMICLGGRGRGEL